MKWKRINQKHIYHKIRNKLLPFRISTKITFAYFIIILITVIVSGMIFQKVSLYSAQKNIGEVSVQTLSSIETGIDIIFEDVNNYSKMIFSDDTLQDLLRSGSMYSDLNKQAQVSHYLYNMLQTTSLIESVIIYDQKGYNYSVGKKMPPTLLIPKVEDAPWFHRVIKNKGSYLLSLNAEGAFSIQKEGNFISLIRQIRDINTSEALGILAINISEDTIRQSYAGVIEEANVHIAILDENGQQVVQSLTKDHIGEIKNIFGKELFDNESGFLTYQQNGLQYLVSYALQKSRGWHYISILPIGNLKYENSWLVVIVLIILIINGIITFLSSIFISKNITTPISQLLDKMQKVETGVFETLSVDAKDYEFKKLFIGYNIMITEIKHLIARVIEKQNTIRKTELNVLQAQIKPHFLYNTLDSALSLALSEDMEKVCELIEALESYYRLSVSKGREVVTVGEEIALVKNYLIIQKIRYPDLFEVIYDIDERCLEVPMLKLVLQPLVENALYHGIRPTRKKGTITICAIQKEHKVILSVTDNGVGMSSDKIDAIFNCAAALNESFGLWGTLERVRIHYNCTDAVTVESRPAEGTKIIISVEDVNVRRTFKSDFGR
jgi:two-component system sensor histidine kinase YesM